MIARRESRKRVKVLIASRRPRARQQRCRPPANGAWRLCESVHSSYVQPRREPKEDRRRRESCRGASPYGRDERRRRRQR